MVRLSRGCMAGVAAAWVVSVTLAVSGRAVSNPDAAKLKNPAKATPESIAAGQTVYGKYCKFCHGEDAKGDGPLAPKGTHPPNLIDATWDHGSTDGEIFTNIKEGIGPKYDMKAMKTKMMDADIWNVVNYLRSIGPKTK